LAGLIRQPLEQLGSADPALHSNLVAHAVVGQLSDHLWQRTRPTTAETAHIVAFCLAVAAPAAADPPGARPTP
jgi:hypothetical protein